MKRIFHDIPQNSDEWVKLRRGLITASNFATIMANEGKAFGEPAKKYAMRLVIEEATNKSIETYSNNFMQQGTELEPMARKKYEDENLCTVLNGGFMEFDKYGGSADGRIEDGIIEIKSVIYSTHFETLLKQGYDTSYQWQIQGNLWLYDVKVCDFISYCKDFPPNKQVYVYRVERDELVIERLRERLFEFTKLVDEYRKAL